MTDEAPERPAAPGGSRVLLSVRAHDRYGHEIRLAVPGVELIPVSAGDPLGERDAEIGWATVDQYASGELSAFYDRLLRTPGLRWVQLIGAGMENPRLVELGRRGITLFRGPDSGPPIAEFVLRAALDHLQGAERWRAAQRRRAWERHDYREVRGSSWLVVGAGHLGRAVTAAAQGLGASVTVARRSALAAERADATIGTERIPAYLPRMDVVVLCVPSTDETRHLVNAESLAAMRPDSLLVNVSRGAVVDEAALLDALDRGRPGRAALDVAATEPLPADSPLWVHPKIVITPHVAAATAARYDRFAAVFIDRLRAATTHE